MDVTSWLLRRTAPRVLLLTAPGGTEARLAVERLVRELGWRMALSPAEANTLVIAGADHRFEDHVRRVWDAVPAPRVRVDVPTAADAEHTLASVLGMLHDTERQRAEATRARPSPDQTAHAEHMTAGAHGNHGDHQAHGEREAHTDHEPHAGHGGNADHANHESDGAHADHDEHGGHGGHRDHSGDDSHGDHSGHGDQESHGDNGGHGGSSQMSHDHASSGHMAHGGHDHHMAGMEMPGGVPMADRAEDRDGLTLDQLHVPLGPALPLWPAGLIVHTRLQGDVIQHAAVELLTEQHDPFWSHHPLARRLDSCYRLLALTGWGDAATAAQRFRDEALNGHVPDTRRWATRVRRSRMLRWLLSGVGVTPEGDDALDRLHGWLDATTERPGTTIDALPSLLEGAELANARLIVASLDLGPLAVHEVHHG